jgi:hypothetical protein
LPPAGFPHSEILGSQSGYRLPEAYRRFLRPSSVPGAKASTVCPYKLEPQRCSRPLCSSQGTGGPLADLAPAATSSGSSIAGGPDRVCTGLRFKLAPEALRTQQRVRRRHPLVRVPLSEDLYLRGELMSAPNNRCSTLEHLLSDIRTQTRLWIACATSAP